MSVLKCTCPRCGQPLQVAQTLPARIKCPKCSTGFTISAPKNSNASVAPGTPPVAAVSPFTPGPAPQSMPAPLPGDNGMHEPLSNYRRSSSGMGLWIVVGVGAVAAVVLVVVLVMLLNRGGTDNKNIPLDNVNSGGDGGMDIVPDGSVTGASAEDVKAKKAVDKGIAYLKHRLLQPDGKLYYYGTNDDAHVGAAALAAMTLIECGVPTTDPAVQKAISLVNGQESKMTFSYTLALSILFLDRLIEYETKEYEKEKRKIKPPNVDQYKKTIRHLALQLVGNQHITGGWDYLTQKLTPAEEQTLIARLALPTFKPGGFKPAKNNRVYRDNSISQFVILALWSARKHGVAVEQTLLMEEENFKYEQHKEDGSWPYSRNNDSARDATTCAGLICLAIGHAIRDEIEEKKNPPDKNRKSDKKLIDITKTDPNIAKAFNYLSTSTPLGKTHKLAKGTVDKRSSETQKLEDLYKNLYKTASEYYELNDNNPRKEMLRQQVLNLDKQIQIMDKNSKDLYSGMIIGADAWGDLYFIWSVERVAVIYGKEKIGHVDWYKWGKEIILQNQQPDGSWKERFPGVPDTCFALLFLKRVNIVKDLTDKLRQLMASLGIGGAPGRGVPPGPAFPVKKYA